MCDTTASRDLIFKVQFHLAIAYEMLEQIHAIASIELAGMPCHDTRDVRCAIDPDTVHLDDLPRLSHLAISSRFCGQVHDDRAWAHALHHRGRDEQWSPSTWNCGSG